VVLMAVFLGLILLLVYYETEGDFPTRHCRKRYSVSRR
jgi:hypothetical protein